MFASNSASVQRREYPALVGKRILVVDDDFRNIFALTALLERGNAEVLAAESGAEALAITRRSVRRHPWMLTIAQKRCPPTGDPIRLFD